MAPQIKELTEILNERDSTLTVRVESPDDPNGESYLDIFVDDFAIEVSYRPDYGFGIFLSDDGFGQRPDEVYRKPSKAADRIIQLRDAYRRNGHVDHLTLPEIRELSKLTQVQLATALSIKQPSVNRVEKRENVKVETVANYVRAMGGRLEMRVVFDDMEARLDLPELKVG